jgi:hypothetical protein
MITLMTAIYIDSETALSWQRSSKECCELNRATAEAIRESLRRATDTLLKSRELISQSAETIERIRTAEAGVDGKIDVGTPPASGAAQ